MNYPIAIPFPEKTAEMDIQAYPAHYATFGGSLTLVTDNWKEFKKEFFQKVESELGIKHQFLSPHHPQSNSILEKIHYFLKVCVRKHTHGKLDWEDNSQLSFFSFRMLPGIHFKESPFFLPFGRDPTKSSCKTAFTHY